MSAEEKLASTAPFVFLTTCSDFSSTSCSVRRSPLTKLVPSQRKSSGSDRSAASEKSLVMFDFGPWDLKSPL